MKEVSNKKVISKKDLKALDDLVDIVANSDPEGKIVKGNLKEDVKNLKEKTKTDDYDR